MSNGPGTIYTDEINLTLSPRAQSTEAQREFYTQRNGALAHIPSLSIKSLSAWSDKLTNQSPDPAR